MNEQDILNIDNKEIIYGIEEELLKLDQEIDYIISADNVAIRRKEKDYNKRWSKYFYK